jgi:hypothetical protein
MGGLFGGGGSKPAPKEPEKPQREIKKATSGAQEQAGAMQARRGGAYKRSLLSTPSTATEDNGGLSTKLGGQ